MTSKNKATFQHEVPRASSGRDGARREDFRASPLPGFALWHGSTMLRMGAPPLAEPIRPTIRIGGTVYPVLLPTLRDARLQLAAVIVSLQVLGQAAFDFELSIAQILVSLGTCAVLELAITMRRERVIMWPASALLTGNGVAFVLRVPGTEPGDWWSTRGWWVFAGAATIAILSKHVIRVHGRHVFNPSNLGLVLAFILLGQERADPLALWWGPMSLWMALALAIIVGGGLLILRQLRLLAIAAWFWVSFAAATAVVAASGHSMTARWHLGPITGFEFWRVLVFSPEVLVFLFFMITDPRTTPARPVGRRVYSVSVALLAVLLIAPTGTEFWTKVALLGALALVCAGRPLVSALAPRFPIRLTGKGRPHLIATAAIGCSVVAGALVLAGAPARPVGVASPATAPTSNLPRITILPSKGVQTRLDATLARQITADILAALRTEQDALQRRDKARAAGAAAGQRLQSLWRQIALADGRPILVPERRVERVELHLEPAIGQDPPLVIARISGQERLLTVAGNPASVSFRGNETTFDRTLEFQFGKGRYLIVGVRGGTPEPVGTGGSAPLTSSGLGGVRLENIAEEVGLDFRQGAFRYRIAYDPAAMMGGGVCWLDIDNDGWLDLFAVNSFSERDIPDWQQHGGLPRSGLFHNEKGRFTDISARSGAGLQIRGNGCVAADLNGDGFTDIFVSAAGNDALLWNDGKGRFREGARDAGITSWGWHAGAAVGDVNGDGRPDVFVAGYTDMNAPTAGSDQGFPNDHAGVRDLLYLNTGNDARGHATFRDIASELLIDAGEPEHALGAVFTDLNADGRIDLVVANDANPNRLYVNLPRPGGVQADPLGLGFRLEERAARAGVADEGAGMGIAVGDYSGDGLQDMVVTNSHRQLHAALRGGHAIGGTPFFTDVRADVATAFDTRRAGWGASWIDLDLDTYLDLVIANGAIPVTGLSKSAEPLQAFENLTGHGHPGQFADATTALGLNDAPRVIGRGIAAADFDNDGDVDIAVNSIGGKLMLLRTTGATGHWLEVSVGTFAPGASITVVLPDGRRLVRELHAGSSYLSSEDPRAHFGLGSATSVRELIVRYPGGRDVRRRDVQANQLVALLPPATPG